MEFPSISESILRQNATEKSFSRGQDYQRHGAVGEVAQRGDFLYAEVEGSEFEPYQVTIGFNSKRITSTYCTCPYDFGGWCKHIVATLLTCIHEPEQIEVRPTLTDLLEPLDLAQTRQLLQALVKAEPQLIEQVDRLASTLATPQPKNSHSKTRRSSIDATSFRRQVQQLLRQTVRRWEDGDDEYDPFEELSPLIERGRSLAENGDGASAIAILEAILQGYLDEGKHIEDYGWELADLSNDIDAVWTEVILSTELDPAQVKELKQQLQQWQKQLGIDFTMSLIALQQGWHDPTLEKILAGKKISPAELKRNLESDVATDLGLIQLKILERQDRQTEYLNLAKTLRLTKEYLTKLVMLGDVKTAMSLAPKELETLDEASALAKTLRETGHLSEALAIAQQGLTIGGGHALYEFAVWTGEFAEDSDDTGTALYAYQVAFSTRPSLDLYQRLQTLAQKGWRRLKPTLIDALQNAESWDSTQAKVDIFLHEKMWDAAIATVDDHANHLYSSHIQAVMDAVIAYQPNWVIDLATQNAEAIMVAGNSNNYPTAVEWLKRVKAAYLESKQQAKWQTYRKSLELNHGRKRKLMSLMQAANLN